MQSKLPSVIITINKYSTINNSGGFYIVYITCQHDIPMSVTQGVE